MEDDIVDVEPDRVRILSSLEPRKRVADPRSRKSQRQRKAARARWWSRALVGVMALGLLTVAMGVYLLIRSAHDTEQALSSWPLPETPTASPTADEWQFAPPAAGLLSATVAEAEAAALVNVPTEPDTAAGAETHTSLTSPVAEASHEPTVEPDPLAALKPGPVVDTPRKTAAASPAPTVAPIATSPAPPPPAKAAAAASDRTSPPAPATVARPASRASADVALLEAVFPDHDPQKASKTDLFRACQGMSGAEASICRARICVQHPGVPACQ